jgi:hypothetical protein
MSDELIPKIRAWLSTQGYSFEMKSAQLCSASGFGVQLGSFFSDPLTGKSRELDLVATRAVGCQKSGIRLYVNLLIQCKYAPKPWLFFSDNNTHPTALDPYLLKDAKGDSAIYMWPEIPDGPEYGFFRGWQDSAYGATSARFKDSSDTRKNNKDDSSNKDLAYQALESIISAYEAWSAPKSALLSMPRERVYRITIPVIFVKGHLFTVRLVDDDEEIADTRIVRISWKQGEARRGSLIDVVEASAIINYLNQVKAEVELLARAIQEDPRLLDKCARPRVNLSDYTEK